MPSALGHSQWGPSRLGDLPICPQCTLASSESPAAPLAQASEDGAAALTWRHPPLGVGPSCPTGHRRLSPNGLEKSLALNAAGMATGVREVTVLPLDLSSYPVSRGGHHPPSRSCDAPVTFSPIIWFIPHIWEPSPLDCFTEGHRGSKKPGSLPGPGLDPTSLGPCSSRGHTGLARGAGEGGREGEEGASSGEASPSGPRFRVWHLPGRTSLRWCPCSANLLPPGAVHTDYGQSGTGQAGSIGRALTASARKAQVCLPTRLPGPSFPESGTSALCILPGQLAALTWGLIPA